ncbi:TetR/AcrR family transcriptional regulator [Streptomyces radicis]|uniref:TetR/AcrR family transcriptional regulator n=1 Tax=Streptomyces radicis TaxID=1750517 RepID=A0A3A9VYB9_9ACTN|nr:TetR/AcrR family transcriptional regulator [Streptomyces radicis]RKN05522.1 TetR/AcrR family transcriptional regulator [Streptomyces radicis]RKN17391.1 TetR/AcrR family transcriptional regulator [Streptomyces radicis]
MADTHTPTGSAPVRRPRMTAEREAEVLATVVELLRDHGYEALTMDAVAARARCGKATLYRQWHSKHELVAAALRAHRPAPVADIDTGSLRGDLHSLFTRVSDQAEQDTALIAGLARATLDDHELARALRQKLVDPEIDEFTTFIDRAIARGELDRRPAAMAFLPQMVFATVVSRPLFEDEYADADYLLRFLDSTLLPALLHS